jgi:uncharacterized protein (TIGR01244 family)
MESAAVESIVRYAPISESLATAGQPSEAQLEALAAVGFEVVINLALHDDSRYSLKDEEATVASFGMQYVHIPVQFAAPTRANLIAFFEAMERADKRKVFVHCAHNKRVPVFIALHRIAKQGWSQGAALGAMREVWQPDATWEKFIAQTLREEVV